ncbi:MAG: lamin tail domain-containing protein, partial [Salinivirgaceae bacterium]|nr:lamin tail domain-containing protein [Salinivirgaceae bacterium]
SNWKASENGNGGTPGHLNSVYKPNFDSIAPTLIKATITGIDRILFEFNEDLNKFTATDFSIQNFAVDSAIQSSENNALIEVYFDSTLISGNTYNITIKNLSDNCGNAIKDTTIQVLFYLAQENDIIFNEIFTDTTPRVSLPAVEYIELYNRSAYPIDLTNWKLHYKTHPRIFPEYVIESGAYLLLCPNGDANQLAVFGSTLDILSSETLTLSGNPLKLENGSGNIISKLNYNNSWYNNTEKDNGGWSIERIDPENLCSGKYNWTASVSEIGGSPGAKNSVYASNLDKVKPLVNFLKIESDKSLIVEFSEPIDISSLLNLSNYSFSNTNSIDTVSITDKNQSIVRLLLHSSFQYDVAYAFMLNNISDLCGNILKDTTLEFIFNKIEPNDIVITELMIDPTPALGLPEYEYIEIFNNSTKNIHIENWQILINEDEISLPRYTLEPDSLLLVLTNSAYDNFNFIQNKVGVSGFALPNSSAKVQLLDTSRNIINNLHYYDSWYNNPEKENGGYSLEIIDPDNQCGGKNNWKASAHSLGGTPGVLNAVNADNLDQIPPIVLNIIPLSKTLIGVQFSEPVSFLGLSPMYYSIDNYGQPNHLQLATDKEQTVLLNFEKGFKQGETYKISVNQIADNCFNAMADTVITFVHYIPQFYDIVVNEIMANSTPSVGLPEADYVELYNNTNYEINAYQWYIVVGNSVRKLPYLKMQANRYAIITNAENSNLFTSTNIVSVAKLPNLPLTGAIHLLNSQGDLISQTNYESSWFTDDFKAEGGFSLERIDYNNPDETFQNWQASIANLGGTPGTVNSIYKNNPDETPPNLVRAFPINNNVVGIEFSEPLNISTLGLNMIEIEGEPHIIDSLSVKFDNLKIIHLYIKYNLQPGVEYSVMVSDSVTDIAGNQIINRSTKLALPVKASTADLIINEILWNPFEGGVDFVELYNSSAFPINLKQFYIASYNENGDFKNNKQITSDGALVFPNEYIVLTENQALVKQQYWTENQHAFIDVDALPSFSNDEGSVVVLDTSGIVIDYLYYNNDMHFGLIADTKGVSLERVNFNRSSQEASNWHSASEQSGWATPGYTNSQYNEEAASDKSISIEEDTFTPDNDGINDVLYINYEFGEPGYVANVKIFNAKGQFVKTLAENELLGTKGSLAWDGLSESKQKALAGIYIINIEIFDLDGNVKKYRKVCAVNAIFD